MVNQAIGASCTLICLTDNGSGSCMNMYKASARTWKACGNFPHSNIMKTKKITTSWLVRGQSSSYIGNTCTVTEIKFFESAYEVMPHPDSYNVATGCSLVNLGSDCKSFANSYFWFGCQSPSWVLQHERISVATFIWFRYIHAESPGYTRNLGTANCSFSRLGRQKNQQQNRNTVKITTTTTKSSTV